MSESERDLVGALRAELAAIDPARPCDRRSEVAGLGRARPAREAPVARLAIRLGLSRSAGVDGGGDGAPPDDPAPFGWSAAAEHCRAAYLRGRFLSAGSLSLAAGRTHLEFVVPPEEAPVLAGWLAEAELPAAWRIRRGRGVVTWKSAEIVGTFLRRIGAGAAVLELEARQVSRAMRGDLNRVINAESANVGRAVAAAARQLEAIAVLAADGRLAEQPYVVRLVADARRETPESTFGELAERLELHRSTVQRALERLERLAHHDEDSGRAADRGRQGPGRARGRRHGSGNRPRDPAALA